MTSTTDIQALADQWQAGQISLSAIRRQHGAAVYQEVQAELQRREVGTLTLADVEIDERGGFRGTIG